MLDLEQRRVRTERVVARFRDRPFSWTGRRTCLHLARAQMVALGHKPPKMPDLRSALGAKRALAATGHAGIMDLLDSLLPRIAPAGMLIGDLALMEGDDAFDAVVIAAGGKVLGYHGDDLARGLVAIEPVVTQPYKAAWRL
ncbi:hypothetical protein ASE95_02775 [Sphingomonas sp. Leaf231]|uniref:DUF6950 family protein n=1 Tax=Sphingomonas sp. Leaf231 TaxID=1736301 RepID=UPI0006F51FF6|nr:hypothetical protein [Sphingomonas sp. Leaf231]KQN93847.1 hypothetical protein ASE95_02775 [Sphingomonas sp. Leaf231]